MNRINTDFLVLGSGIAGLTFALKAVEYGKVVIVTKKNDIESNTNYAQGGIASVFGNDDSFDLHVKDTLKTGSGLSKETTVRIMVEEGPLRIKELVEFGAQFTMDKESDDFDLGREGGHSRERIIHARDYTGKEVEKILVKAVRDNENINLIENNVAVDLITEHQLMQATKDREVHCFGAYVFDSESKQIRVIAAKRTIICTGGVGQVYQHTTNPGIATGDGLAMAYRAGAMLANLEFMQFHPTTLYHPDAKSFLISEAVRGAGAILRTADGQEFMSNYHEMADLAPRDVVARAIDAELKKRGDECVYLDPGPIGADKIPEKFPKIYAECLKYNIDITRDQIPVVPAAHYMCGGIVCDETGQTTVNDLFVCGEAAHTGVHGANRLASNSLLEALVYGHKVAECLKENDSKKDLAGIEIPDWDDSGTFNPEEWVLIAHDKSEIRNIMWDYVGIVRSDFRLIRAKRRVKLIVREVEEYYRKTKISEELLELRNLATVAKLIIRSSMVRKESRGLHYNVDYPNKNDNHFLHDTIIQQSMSEIRSIR